MTYSSTMSIEEMIDGDEVGRVIILSGAGLPVQGAGWGGENVVVTTNYPGNTNEATQQILGPKEGPSSFAGEWHRNMLRDSGCFLLEGGTSTRLVEPRDFKIILEDFFRAGHLLRVTWSQSGPLDGQNHNEVRLGRAGVWNFTFDRIQDIKWTVTFNWKSRGESKKPTLAKNSSVHVLSNRVSASLEAALEKARVLNHHYNSPSHLTLGQLDSILSYPKKVLERYAAGARRITSNLKAAGDLITKTRDLPWSLANTVLDTATNTVAIGNQFIEEMGRTPYEMMTAKSKASDVARAASQFGAVNDAAEIASERARELNDILRQVIASARQSAAMTSKEMSRLTEHDILATHVVRSGETIEMLSMRYYKTPDNGVDILRANRMPWHQATLRPGTPLIIPRIVAKNTLSV